jgi:hypothetical protein
MLDHKPAKGGVGQLFNVFTIQDGRIVRVRDFALRSEARVARGSPEPRRWHY